MFDLLWLILSRAVQVLALARVLVAGGGAIDLRAAMTVSLAHSGWQIGDVHARAAAAIDAAIAKAEHDAAVAEQLADSERFGVRHNHKAASLVSRSGAWGAANVPGSANERADLSVPRSTNAPKKRDGETHEHHEHHEHHGTKSDDAIRDVSEAGPESLPGVGRGRGVAVAVARQQSLASSNPSGTNETDARAALARVAEVRARLAFPSLYDTRSFTIGSRAPAESSVVAGGRRTGESGQCAAYCPADQEGEGARGLCPRK